MQNEPDIEALRAELADKETMLADLESGKIPHGLGHPFENRQTELRRRVEQIKSAIRGSDANRA
jgi:hypothetical protein